MINQRLLISSLVVLAIALRMKKADGSSIQLGWKDIQTMNSHVLCSFIPAYIRKGTNLKCWMGKIKLSILYNGTKLAARECQYLFKNRPWNCSAASELTPKIVYHAIPETAFLYAINSAGMAYSLAWACTAGKTKDCKCKKPDTNKDIIRTDRSQIEIKRINNEQLVLEDQRCTKTSLSYGIAESRYILKNTKERDIRWRMDNHNKEAGRLALTNGPINKNTLCSCHGVSGACTISKCTLKLPRFSDISDYLMEKYKSAVRMASDNYGNLIPHERTLKSPTVHDLVYLRDSPSFCKKDKDYGTLGTKGRECQINSNGPESCKVLCCNRGHKTILKIKKTRCECTFKYCCKVTCEECEKQELKHVCK